MTFLTSSGQAGGMGGTVGAGGTVQFGSAPLYFQDLNALGADSLAPLMSANLSGVLVSGTGITVSGLNLSLPVGFQYFAGTVWTNSAAMTLTIGDNAVSYVWGCADGQLRATATTTPPDSFTKASACILAKATAASGVVTLDNSAVWKARKADANARTVTDGPIVYDYANNTAQVVGNLIGSAGQNLAGLQVTDGTNNFTSISKLTLFGLTVSQTSTQAGNHEATISGSGGGSGSSPVASNAVTGTVKTDVTQTDPLVYTKATADTLLAGKAAAAHTHSESDVTGLTADLASLSAGVSTNAANLTAHQADTNAHPVYAKANDLDAHKTASVIDHPDGSVTAAKLAANAVTAAAIATGAVTPSKIQPTAVTPGSYTNANVTVNAAGQITAAANGSAGSGGTLSDASTTVKGITQLSTAPASAGTPIAVGDNDARMTNARTPTAHAASHASGGADALSLAASQVSSGTLDAARLPDATHIAKGAVLLADDANATSGRAVEATDSRLSNSRTPNAHASTHGSGGTDAVSPSSIGAAAASHTHAAADIVSGTVATARLGSGTADNTKLLRGDQTWQTIPTALPPNGSAGGDLSGTYPNPGVAKVNGVAISGTPTSGQVLTATGAAAASWATPSSGSGGGAPVAYRDNSYTNNSLDFSTYSHEHVVLFNANKTLTFSGATAGGRYLVSVRIASTSYALTWPSSVRWPGGTAPTLTATTGKDDLFEFLYDGTSFYGRVLGQNY